MNTEKAIDLLDNLLGMVDDNQGNDYDAALHMAIDALKAQADGDTIRRLSAIDAMANTLWHYPNECYRNLNEYEFAKGLAELGLKSVPSAQPEIVRCKDCKHWKDSDGVYRRGIGAESKCPVNIRAVYEGNFYCADAERRIDEQTV